MNQNDPRSAAGLAALALALGLALAGAPAGAASGTGAIADRHVLVSDTAWLRTAPDDAAPHARLAGAGTPAGTRHALRLVKELPDAMEVEPIDDAGGARTCYEDVKGLRELALRLYVAKADLLPVTVRELKLKHKDGTSLTLAGGVAVAAPATAGEPHHALIAGMSLPFTPPPGTVGSAFVPSHHFDVSKLEPYSPAPTARLDGLPIGESKSVGIYKKSGKVRGPDRLLDLRAPCMAMSVLEPIEPLGRGTGMGGTGMIGRTASSHGALLKKGAPLFWPDGSPAGSTRAKVVLATDSHSFRGAPPAVRECRPVDLLHGVSVVRESDDHRPEDGGAADRTLFICFDRSSVETWGPVGM
jgi:hypothetical protein